MYHYNKLQVKNNRDISISLSLEVHNMLKIKQST